MTESKTPTSVGLLLIGTELLTGKIRDANGPWLIDTLRDRGVSLREIRVILDDTDTIADAVVEMASKVDALLTSGGVGPTHDDLTMKAIAKGFGVDLAEHRELRARIDRHYEDSPELLSIWRRMAMLPEGSTLVQEEGARWPVYHFRNLYILPGVPEIFRHQVTSILPRLSGRPTAMSTIYFALTEGELAAALERVVEAHPGVEIGSYPVFWRQTEFKTRVTIEADSVEVVEAAKAALRAEFDDHAIVDIRDGQQTLLEQ